MPKKESILTKNLYITINLFFLIAAPFNLGYFGYSLIQELLPAQEMKVAGASLVNEPLINDEIRENLNKETDNTAFSSPTPSPVTEDASKIEMEDEGKVTRERPVSTIYICVSDPEPSHWSIFTHTKSIAEITPEDLANNREGSLLMYCQTKIRSRDIDSDVTIIRRGEGDSQEKVINMDEIKRYAYIIFSYEGGEEIKYELRNDRP